MWDLISNVSYELAATVIVGAFMLVIGNRVRSAWQERARLRASKPIGDAAEKQIEQALMRVWLRLNWLLIKPAVGQPPEKLPKARLFEAWSVGLGGMLQRTAVGDGTYKAERMDERDQALLTTVMNSKGFIESLSGELRRALEHREAMPRMLVFTVTEVIQAADHAADQIGIGAKKEFPPHLALTIVPGFRELMERCQKLADLLQLRFGGD